MCGDWRVRCSNRKTYHDWNRSTNGKNYIVNVCAGRKSLFAIYVQIWNKWDVYCSVQCCRRRRRCRSRRRSECFASTETELMARGAKLNEVKNKNMEHIFWISFINVPNAVEGNGWNIDLMLARNCSNREQSRSNEMHSASARLMISISFRSVCLCISTSSYSQNIHVYYCGIQLTQ